MSVGRYDELAMSVVSFAEIGFRDFGGRCWKQPFGAGIHARGRGKCFGKGIGVGRNCVYDRV